MRMAASTAGNTTTGAGKSEPRSASRRKPEATQPDAWAYSTADGGIDRIEISSTADPARIDRWEFYDTESTGSARRPGNAAPSGGGHERRRSAGQVGALRGRHRQAVEFDEDRDGRPDRRLTYKEPRWC